MTYVFLVPHPDLARVTDADRVLYQHNKTWAEQVARRDSDVEVEVIEAVGSRDDVWPATFRAYRQAARAAGTGGTLGVLVGHGIGGSPIAADLAPPRVLRTDEPEATELARRAVHELNPNQERVRAIRDLFRAYVRRVDLYTCTIGSPSGVSFLNALAEVWRVEVRGLRGRLVSERRDGVIAMTLRTTSRGVPRGPWVRRVIPEEAWRRSELLERPIELPDSLLPPKKAAASSSSGRMGRAPRTASLPAHAGAAPRVLRR